MLESTPNAILRTTLATLALLLGSTALAQWSLGELTTHDANLDAWIAHQQALIQAQQREWMVYFVRLYREETGDDQTADALAMEFGRNLYCERNAAECWEADWRCRDGFETVVRDRTRCAESWGVLIPGIATSTESWGVVNAGSATGTASNPDASHRDTGAHERLLQP